MNIKFLISLAIIIVSCSGVLAQESPFDKIKKTYNISGDDDEDTRILKNVTKDLFLIVRQDYLLESQNGGGTYGRRDREYFGRTYGLAIVADNQIWVDRDIKQYWQRDKYFKRYEKVDSLQPVNSFVSFRSLNSAGAKWEKLENEEELPNIDGFGRYKPSEELALNSIRTVQKKREDEGWLIVAKSKVPLLEDEESAIMLHFSSEKISMTDKAVLNRELDGNVIGGFFLLPNYERGKMELYLTGVLKKNKDGKWFISFINDYVPEEKIGGLTKVSSLREKTEGEKEKGAKTEKDKDDDDFFNLTPSNNKKYRTTITILDGKGNPVQDVSVTLDNKGDKIYRTDKHGKVVVLLKRKKGNQIYINGEAARCVDDGEKIEVICVKRRKGYEPLDKRKC